MSYHYTDQSRESDPRALPDVEVFYQTESADKWTAQPGGKLTGEKDSPGFYYAYGFQGQLWCNDPVGPFDTEAEALTAAREAAGF